MATMHRPLLDQTVPEFEAAQEAPPSELSRREFLYLSGATIALAGQALTGCTRAPAEKIVPYRVQPPEVIPGRPLHYASASTLDGYGSGILVESREGRPIKIEGNPDHPASLGASSAVQQALVLELYDPRRLRAPTRSGMPCADTDVMRAVRVAGMTQRRGRGVHLVLPPFSSPLLAHQIASLRQQLPELAIHFHMPVSRSALWQGARLAFGSPLEVRADLKRANVLLSLGADFLGEGPEHLALARAFATRRRMESAQDSMNRLYVVETSMSLSGGVADHRLALAPSQLPAFAAALLGEIARSHVGGGLDMPASLLERVAPGTEQLNAHQHFIQALARDLLANRGQSVVLVGVGQPAVVHAAAHAINALLGNAGSVIGYGASAIVDSEAPDFATLRGLSNALAAGTVESLIVFDTDVAYASAGDLGLGQLIGRAQQSLYFGLFSNATSAACHFAAPAAHLLESWGDTRSLGGTVSIVQPLIAPLYGGRTLSEVLAALLGAPAAAHQLVKSFWRERVAANFESYWEIALARGLIEGTELPAVATPRLSWDWLAELAGSSGPAHGIELNLIPDTRLHDGRFASNPWLLELPCPVTKQTWGNAALLAPALARRLDVGNGDVLELTRAGHTVAAPALVVGGHADGALTLALGWGQEGLAGATAFGADGFRLASSAPSAPPQVYVRRTHRQEELALTQDTMSLGEFEDSILLSSTLEQHRASGADRAHKAGKRPLSMYVTDAPVAARQWGMTIDLNACTGCSACVVACQAENNIPSVGKSGVLKHREMHWLRIDRYVGGTEAEPSVRLEPMACQHCEKAPCEYVCPTAATVHSSDGLNQMIYNRCVGTRFCSNNCPYKVRRFNWFDYHRDERSPRELAANPEVTVRARGVMEKCTYCVQRIRTAEIKAKVEHRALADHDVRTACEQVCPTSAIRFGDVNDPRSEVSRLRNGDRAFQVLPELGAVPRTRYLLKLSNPNPELS